MWKHKNLSGKSSILKHELGKDFINIIYSNLIYRYSYASAGKENIEAMKQLTTSGSGINRYILIHCYKLYEFKKKFQRKKVVWAFLVQHIDDLTLLHFIKIQIR